MVYVSQIIKLFLFPGRIAAGEGHRNVKGLGKMSGNDPEKEKEAADLVAVVLKRS